MKPELVHSQEQKEQYFSFGTENLLNHVANVANVATFDLSQAVDAGQEEINAAKVIIDDALAVCPDNPGALGSPEFAAAIKTISAIPALWFEYRTKIKAAKPSGVPMADIDGMSAPQSAGNDRHDSQASALIALALACGQLFFDERTGKAFIHVAIKGVTHTLTIGSKAFIEWLSFAYYSRTKNDDGPGQSAGEAAIK